MEANLITQRWYKVAWAGVHHLTRAALARLRVLAQTYSWQELWENPTLWIEAWLTPYQQQGIVEFQKNFSVTAWSEYLAQEQIEIIFSDEANYPSLLTQTKQKPEVLFFKGNQSLLKEPSVAIVGSRQMTAYGKQATQQLTRELVSFGVVIVSGCMYGVDLAAQDEVLKSEGKSIGVLGYGFAHLKVSDQRSWFESFLAQGNILISEYPPHRQPDRSTFPLRNRIIAGLSLGVLVVEAAQKSGSLLTARYARAADRKVFAVPGPLNSPLSQGTAWLINHGAQLVTSGEEIINTLQLPGKARVGPDLTKTSLLLAQQQIYQEVQTMPVSTQELQERLPFSLSELLNHLSLMEVQGLVKQHHYRWVVT
jgi:DNA processing protein